MWKHIVFLLLAFTVLQVNALRCNKCRPSSNCFGAENMTIVKCASNEDVCVKHHRTAKVSNGLINQNTNFRVYTRIDRGCGVSKTESVAKKGKCVTVSNTEGFPGAPDWQRYSGPRCLCSTDLCNSAMHSRLVNGFLFICSAITLIILM